MADWEELPQEILELIACRLAIEDFLAFGGVCTSWRSAAAKETYKAKSEAPWLMIYGYNQIAEFSSPSTGRIYPMPVPGSHVQTLSAPGWILALQEDGDGEYRIFNPLSRVSIELPALEKLHHELRLSAEHDELKRLWYGPLGIIMMALSSSPSLSRSYRVMICCDTWFAFHKSGEDAWTVVSLATDLHECNVLKLIYYNGLFVALNVYCEIMTLNERKRRMEWRLNLGHRYAEGSPYLVECSGSLLVAWAISAEEYYGPVEWIRVFKVDLEKGTEEEVKSLGNSSLFLNYTSSFSVEFNAESCLPGMKPNHVYFLDYDDDQMKSYSMEDGEIETYFDATAKRIYEWFQPAF